MHSTGALFFLLLLLFSRSQQHKGVSAQFSRCWMFFFLTSFFFHLLRLGEKQSQSVQDLSACCCCFLVCTYLCVCFNKSLSKQKKNMWKGKKGKVYATKAESNGCECNSPTGLKPAPSTSWAHRGSGFEPTSTPPQTRRVWRINYWRSIDSDFTAAS